MRRRRRRKQATEESGSEGDAAESYDALMAEKKKRECPVPKPGGLVGQVMGFKEHESQRPSQVIVKELQGRRGGHKHLEGNDTP